MRSNPDGLGESALLDDQFIWNAIIIVGDCMTLRLLRV